MTISQTITETDVLDWTLQLCKALEENYRQDHIDSLHLIIKAHEENGKNSDFAKRQVIDFEEGVSKLTKFRIHPTRKYLKIIKQEFDTGRNEYRDQSVHAFVDKQTGGVYKPSGWEKPAKYVRYKLSDSTHREYLFNPKNVDWSGGYLYLR